MVSWQSKPLSLMLNEWKSGFKQNAMRHSVLPELESYWLLLKYCSILYYYNNNEHMAYLHHWQLFVSLSNYKCPSSKKILFGCIANACIHTYAFCFLFSLLHGCYLTNVYGQEIMLEFRAGKMVFEGTRVTPDARKGLVRIAKV